jgi:hypothetical protein
MVKLWLLEAIVLGCYSSLLLRFFGPSDFQIINVQSELVDIDIEWSDSWFGFYVHLLWILCSLTVNFMFTYFALNVYQLWFLWLRTVKHCFAAEDLKPIRVIPKCETCCASSDDSWRWVYDPVAKRTYYSDIATTARSDWDTPPLLNRQCSFGSRTAFTA